MPKRISGVSKRLIDIAREEFLKNGFENSSIRTIAARAQTSPRAIYTRFANKEALFNAVVEPVVEEFKGIYEKEREAYWERARNKDFSVEPEQIYIKYIKYAYEHKEDFILLLRGSKGTRYENFCKEIADYEIKGVNDNVPVLFSVERKDSMVLFVEKITYAFFENLFSPLLEDVDLKTAVEYVTILTRFYNTGISMGDCKAFLEEGSV